MIELSLDSVTLMKVDSCESPLTSGQLCSSRSTDAFSRRF